MRILLVEDDPGVQALLVELATRDGFDVQCAVDGDASIKLFRTGQHDLVLLDLMLPNTNGFEVLQDMRARSASPETHRQVFRLFHASTGS